MKISFITPSYNNLDYLKLCHRSLLEYIPNDIEWEHCIGDDGSSDNTLNWLINESANDKTIKFIREENRIGHTELYNKLVEFSTGDIIMIFHADMFLVSKNTIKNLLKYLKPKTVISAMRVEPIGMYPASFEKILINFGGLNINDIDLDLIKNKIKQLETTNDGITIKSIFAPWMCFKSDYLPMDKLFSPFPHEDECVFLRFILKNYNIIQSNDALIPHFCSRGHRKTDKVDPTKDNDSYAYYENKARRNYLRKWQSWIKFKEYQYPVVPKLYNMGFVIKNCYENLIYSLEPWCSSIYIENTELIKKYISKEQKETLFDLNKRIKHISEKQDNDIIIEFDASKLNQNNIQIITQLSEIISDSGEVGEMEYDIFKLKIRSLDTYEKYLADLDSPFYTNKLIKSL